MCGTHVVLNQRLRGEVGRLMLSASGGLFAFASLGLITGEACITGGGDIGVDEELCRLHGIPFVKGRADTNAPLASYTQEEDDAYRSLFSNAVTSVLPQGDESVRWVEVDCCPICRKMQRVWWRVCRHLNKEEREWIIPLFKANSVDKPRVIEAVEALHLGYRLGGVAGLRGALAEQRKDLLKPRLEAEGVH